MPYIDRLARGELDDEVRGPRTPGELNYVLTSACLDYMDIKGGDSYITFNDIIGALEACKLEFYRRVVNPYEDTKIAANGDVYQPDKQGE